MKLKHLKGRRIDAMMIVVGAAILVAVVACCLSMPEYFSGSEVMP